LKQRERENIFYSLATVLGQLDFIVADIDNFREEMHSKEDIQIGKFLKDVRNRVKDTADYVELLKEEYVKGRK